MDDHRSPTYKLDVTGLGHFTGLVDAANFVATSTTATSTFAGQLAVGSSALNVLANGSVGIGTASPTSILTVGGGGNSVPQLTLLPNSGTSVSLGAVNGGSQLGFFVGSTAMGAVDANGFRADAGRAFAFTNNSTNPFTTLDTGIERYTAGQLLVSDGTSAGNARDLFMRSAGIGASYVGTAPPTNGLLVQGSVGVGTTSPFAKLALTDNSSAVSPTVYLSNTFSARNAAVLDLRSLNSGNQLRIGDAQADTFTYDIGRASDGLLHFYGNQSGANGYVFDGNAGEKVRITTAGNVGIGSTSPSRLLSVSDDGTYSGYFTGRVGIGMSTPPQPLTVVGTNIDGVIGAFAPNSKGITLNPNLTSGIVDIYSDYFAGGEPKLHLSSYSDRTGANGLTIQSGGSVGIGSTTPYAKLSVQGAGTGTGVNFQTTNSSQSPLVSILDNGNVGIGTTSPSTKFSVGGAAGDTSGHGYFTGGLGVGLVNTTAGTLQTSGAATIAGTISGTNTSASQAIFTGWTPTGTVSAASGSIVIGGSGFSGLNLHTNADGNTTVYVDNIYDSASSATIFRARSSGTPVPQLTLSGAGSIRFNAYGAGTLTTDGSGNITASSDERLKNIQGNFTAGLAQLEQLNPILYTWKPETGFDASTTYAGFSAQNVQAAIPEAVGQGKDGYLTLQDRPLIATVVNAIKELAAKLTDLATTVASFADHFTTKELVATNGTFHALRSDTLSTDELCVGTVCVTQSQFMAVFSATDAATPTSVPSSPSNPRDVPPPESVSSTSTPEAASSTPDALPPEPANENELLISADETTPTNDNPPPDPSASSAPETYDPAKDNDPALEAANDNPPPADSASTSQASGFF